MTAKLSLVPTSSITCHFFYEENFQVWEQCTLDFFLCGEVKYSNPIIIISFVQNLIPNCQFQNIVCSRFFIEISEHNFHVVFREMTIFHKNCPLCHHFYPQIQNSITLLTADMILCTKKVLVSILMSAELLTIMSLVPSDLLQPYLSLMCTINVDLMKTCSLLFRIVEPLTKYKSSLCVRKYVSFAELCLCLQQTNSKAIVLSKIRKWLFGKCVLHRSFHFAVVEKC